ncbi:MAG: ATP phosphoribosyltransferase [Candidatus Dormibacteraceae bacterium]
MISLAIPTGALLAGSLELLGRSAVVALGPEEIGRQLLVERGGIRVILVRPSDVPAYVDHGAADLGIVGKDSLVEFPGSRYELVDLGFGACTMVVATPELSPLGGPSTWPPLLRVATKYPHATATYMRSLGQTAEIVRLHGSVELAPLVGLVDAIVDLSATGTTLRENRLRVVAEVFTSTARLIANQAALKRRSPELQALVARVRAPQA